MSAAPQRPSPPPACLRNGGDIGALLRAQDWQSSPLGPPDHWPQLLRTTIRLLLTAAHPLYLFWGADLLCFYNDAYTPFIGAERHPGSLGRPAREVWAEVWEQIGPQLAHVMAGRGEVWQDNVLLPITRNGRREDAFWTYSYSPIDDDEAPGGVAGVFVVVSETTEQIMSARRITAGRESFAELFDQAPMFMTLLRGPDHRFVMANPAYMKLTGDRNILGITLAEALPETSAQGFGEILRQVFSSGQPHVARASKYTMQVAPGDPPVEHYVDFVYQPIRDETGEVTDIFVIGTDVTAQKHAERRQACLVDLADRLRTAHTMAEISQTAAQVLGRYLVCSRAGYATIVGDHSYLEADWTNYGLASMAGPRLFRALGPAFCAPLDAGEVLVIRNIATNPATRMSQDAWRRIDIGAVINVPLMEHGKLAAIAFVQSIQPRHWTTEEVNLVKDVADRTWEAAGRARAVHALHQLNETLEERVRQSTAALLDREALIRTFFNHSLECHVVLVQGEDGEFRFEEANPATTSLYGKPRQAIIGNTLAEVIGQDAAPSLALRFTECLATGKPYRYERSIGATTVQASASPVPIEGARLRRIIVTAVDVSERRSLEQQLRQSQKMEAVGQLTGGLAHDFNNLLTGISGSLQMLARRLNDGRAEDAQRYIEAAQDSARRAASLTHRLLAFSRRQTLDPKPLRIAQLAGGMEELIRRTIGPTIALTVCSACPSAMAFVDPSQLENALLNLCINARDAMPNGGSIAIETCLLAVDAETARLRELQPGQYIQLQVSDTGTGMAPDVMARVFDPFFTTKPPGQGTGLGLSMVYGFARQSGGDVLVASQPGHGTSIRLLLPLYDGSGEPAEKPSVQTELHRATPGETVLLVDDEATVRMLVAEILADLGYITLQAGDGRTALEICRSAPRIDLMITDVGLPGGTNGRQLAEAVRALRPGLKILFITGYAQAGALPHESLDDGMHVLTKPFAMDDLAHRIELLMRRGVVGNGRG